MSKTIDFLSSLSPSYLEENNVENEIFKVLVKSAEGKKDAIFVSKNQPQVVVDESKKYV